MIIFFIMWFVMEFSCSREFKEEIGSLVLLKCFVVVGRIIDVWIGIEV